MFRHIKAKEVSGARLPHISSYWVETARARAIYGARSGVRLFLKHKHKQYQRDACHVRRSIPPSACQYLNDNKRMTVNCRYPPTIEAGVNSDVAGVAPKDDARLSFETP
jgi:hypothetical protein